jgi:group I intron endonuclease
MIGIYIIENRITGKAYIGSSIRMKRRLRDHKYALRKGEHKNRKLQNAWNKYGESAFRFAILFRCSVDMLRHYEQMFIDQMKPEYNINPCADRPATGPRKMPNRNNNGWTEERRRKHSATMTGRRHSTKTKSKISNAIKALGMIPPWRK